MNATCRTSDTMTERLRPPAFGGSSAAATRSIRSGCKRFLEGRTPDVSSKFRLQNNNRGNTYTHFMSDTQYIPPPPPPPPPSMTGGTLPPPPAPGTQFDFGKPFTYVFDDPRWLQKILIGGLFYLAGFLIVGWFFI